MGSGEQNHYIKGLGTLSVFLRHRAVLWANPCRSLAPREFPIWLRMDLINLKRKSYRLENSQPIVWKFGVYRCSSSSLCNFARRSSLAVIYITP